MDSAGNISGCYVSDFYPCTSKHTTMSKIAILGTGTVGKTIGSKLIELGHTVAMGSRTKQNEQAIAFATKHPGNASAGTFADAAAYGEMIFNCTKGIGSIDALKMAGEGNLKNKIIVDIANPLDFTKGMPPSLIVSNTNSLGEEIQKEFPDAKVVKALNTMYCGLMVHPALINNGDHTTFISGNDANAKLQVKEILKSFGWAETNIIDLGDITTARGTEMYLALWVRILGSINTGTFNIKVVS